MCAHTADPSLSTHLLLWQLKLAAAAPEPCSQVLASPALPLTLTLRGAAAILGSACREQSGVKVTLVGFSARTGTKTPDTLITA